MSRYTITIGVELEDQPPISSIVHLALWALEELQQSVARDGMRDYPRFFSHEADGFLPQGSVIKVEKEEK